MSREVSKRFPEIIETKENLAGTQKTFTCRVISSACDHVVVLFVAEAPITVANLTLPAGTVTFGHFWTDRPYNVYHWLNPEGATVGLYFNIACDTRIGDHELYWRDLTLDVLVLPQQDPVVLDRDELAADMPKALATQIEDSLQALLRDLPHLPPQLEAQAHSFWKQVFEQPRAEAVAR